MKKTITPKISIVVPIYNTPDNFLLNNLSHLEKQTMKEIEVILVDDGSHRKTADICDDYVDRNSNFKAIHKKNAGLSAARNTGVDNSSGEYILFVDGDDYVEYDTCEQLYPKENKPDVVCACMSKDMGGIIKKYDYSLFKDNKLYINEECKFLRDNVLNFYANVSSVNGKLYKRSFLLNNKLEHNEELKTGIEGIDFCFRLYDKAKSVLFLERYIYNYVFNNNSITETPSTKNYQLILKGFYCIKNYIDLKEEDIDNKERLDALFYNRIVFFLVTAMIGGFFNPKIKQGYRERVKQSKSFIKDNLLIESLQKYDKSKVDSFRNIIIFCIKNKLFLIIYVFSIIRYIQKYKLKSK